MNREDRHGVGLLSLAVSVPGLVRTNDYFRTQYPAVFAEAERRTLARVWSKDDALRRTTNPFDIEMLPYIDDPFRGTVERRVLEDGQTALALELRVARKALAAAGMHANDIDIVLVSSFLPDQPGIGNAAFLARELGIKRPAWNLESACSGGMMALQTASALVAAEQAKRVLVVLSCTYSRVSDYSDTLSWFLGDGAGAFVVGAVPNGEGLLSQQSISTIETCDTFFYEREPQSSSRERLRIRCTPETGRVLQDTAEPVLRTCCEGAARQAGISVKDIDFFVFNTPTAWYAAFAARALGVDPDRTLSTYPRFGNIGPVLMPMNLHHAAQIGKINRGDLVMLYTIGSASTASAALLRWGDVKLGPPPEEPLPQP
jgi:3-oxoacyl-[acyl-carrier-protein] synthase-3